MRIFVAGASGVLGRRLVSLLTGAGHDVTGMTRSASRVDNIRTQGASPIVCDAFDKDALSAALAAARPEIVVNELTAIPGRLDPRRINDGMAPTNRLREEGTRHLVAAARSAGTHRIVSQSIAFVYQPSDKTLATEDEPLYDDAPRAFQAMVRGVRACERTTLETEGIEGIVLRYGYFYGPGTIFARDGSFATDVMRRRVPIVGAGNGVFSFVHLDDAAAATMLALDAPASAVYTSSTMSPRRWVTGCLTTHKPSERHAPFGCRRSWAGWAQAHTESTCWPSNGARPIKPSRPLGGDYNTQLGAKAFAPNYRRDAERKRTSLAVVYRVHRTWSSRVGDARWRRNTAQKSVMPNISSDSSRDREK